MSAPPIGNVVINVIDGGANAAASVPLASVQLKIGCCVAYGSAGSAVSTIIATQNPATLQSALVGGPLLEAAGLVCQAGGTVVCATCNVAVTGTATAPVAAATNTGNAAITTTLDSVYGAWDTYFVEIVCTAAGTLGTAPGPSISISLDAGRNYGAPVSLGSALTYGVGGPLTPRAVGGTGILLDFTTAQTMAVGDSWKFSTTAMTWNDTGVQAAINKYFASQYAVSGVGSTHLVGVCASGDVTNYQTYLQAGVAGYVFPRGLCELVDALVPTAWGGSGQTEAAWIAALQTEASGLIAQPRVCAGAGQYNTPSPYPGVGAGSFSYRRPGTWSQAVRRTQIGLATRAGAVIDGAYSTIVVNPQTDPADGFVYHDERVTPGLNASRIATLQTWPKQGAGFYQCQEPLLSPTTSQFTELVLGNVVDAACDIAYAQGVQWVSSSLVVQANGTLDPVARNNLQSQIQNALQQGLVAQTPGLASSVVAVVSKTANVLATGNIPVTITVTPFGYANAVTFTINLNTSGVA
jgi:hypothetical protein